MWCDHCKDDCPTQRDFDTGSTCCTICGKILQEDFFSDAPMFVKTSSGQTRLSGAIQRMASEYSLSRERTLSKGRDEISYHVDALSMSGGDTIINPAFNFYKIAVERNFTKGRNTSHVAAACLYIACRKGVCCSVAIQGSRRQGLYSTERSLLFSSYTGFQETRQRVPMLPYLLIDFSNYLQINVYALGAVFLQLCKLLSLEEHPIVQKPIDPSLFMNRFTQRLLGQDNRKVTRTALNIIASMKRDWMQTGRKPSGLCGAALYISVHAHQLTYSKAAIVNVVHICEATLTKRLIEFENTDSASLTTEELDEMADELREGSNQSQVLNNLGKGSGISELLCQHKNGKRSHYAHGLCKDCYDDFIEISGGLQGGSEPPAFQRAEMQRKENADKEKKLIESNNVEIPFKVENNDKYESILADKLAFCATSRENPSEARILSPSKKCKEFTTGDEENEDSAHYQSPEQENAAESGDDDIGLSDIDDAEVEGYLHTEEEKQYKKIIWEEMNKEYIEEQALKEAAAAAAREEYVAMYGDDEEAIRAAQELAAASAAAVAKSRKERRQKRADEAKNMGPAKNAAEATSQMLKRKTFSSRINYDALKALYTSWEGDAKKQRAESNADDVDESQPDGKRDDEAPEGGDYGDYNNETKDNYDYNEAAGDELYDDYYGNEDNYTGGDYEGYDEDY